MTIDSKQVAGLVSSAGRPVGVKELLKAGGFHPGEQTELKRVLRELVKDGRVLREGKRFRPADAPRPKQKSGPAWQGKKPAEVRAGARRKDAPAPAKKGPPRTRPTRGKTVVGIIHHHRDGFAFLKPIVGQDSEDVFIPPDEARKALDNDQVEVEIVPGRDGRTAGRVLEVKSRTRQLVIGTYCEEHGRAWVEPREQELGAIRVPKTQLARPGDVVKVKLGVGESMFDDPSRLTGEVAGSLGSQADHSVEVLSVAFSKGFQDEFPPEVMEEADAIPLEVSAKEAKGEKRRDLRELKLVTIDGEDARDFDDAVFCEAHPRGWRLVVAIADVSHYVQEETALDTEALRRATSVYLPGRVLPMLPERLSNGICSLRPDVDRLCMVADMVIDAHGQTLDSEIYPAVMRSHARCTYTEVHDVLNGKHVSGRSELKPLFDRLFELSRTLTAMRLRRGAIDFDLPEQRVELGDDGLPARMVRRERWESHRLVEECMLAANEAVARFFRQQDLPTVNRYHGEPDEERLDLFLNLLGAYGVRVPPGDFTSKSMNEVLQQLDGHPEQRALNQLALRSMMQAVYSSQNAGHYGLGAEDYLHFTSPIRRYPDLLVHRLLKALWKRGKKRLSADQLDAETERLEALAVQCSERERAAMQVEREVNQLYACLLLKDHLGEDHPGTVAGLTDHGFYVQLDELLVEGFAKGETVFPDFEFDQSTYRMTFGNGLVVKVGAKCMVRVLNVNLERKQIDFQVLELEGETVESEALEAPAPRRPQGRPSRHGEADRKWRSQDRGGRFGPQKGGRPQRGEAQGRSTPGSSRFGAPREEQGRSRFKAAAPRSEGKGRGRAPQAERSDSGSTRRFGKDERPQAAPPPQRGGKQAWSRFARPGERRVPQQAPRRFESERPDKKDRRREQPPPQAWEQREEPREEVEPREEAPRQFDARAVLDRLWRERGGKKR